MNPIPIHIDLRNLTQAHLDEAMPNIGTDKYAAPCIIGTLIPEDRRAEFDTNGGNPTSIRRWVESGEITMPADQLDAAISLQAAFDDGDKGWLRAETQAWIEVPAP